MVIYIYEVTLLGMCIKITFIRNFFIYNHVYIGHNRTHILYSNVNGIQ